MNTTTTHDYRVARRGRRRLSHSMFLIVCTLDNVGSKKKIYISRRSYGRAGTRAGKHAHAQVHRNARRYSENDSEATQRTATMVYGSRHKSQSVDSRGGTLRQDLNYTGAETRIVKISRLLPIFGLAVDTSGDAYDPRRHFVPGHCERNERGGTGNENPPISENTHVQTLADYIIKSGMLGES